MTSTATTAPPKSALTPGTWTIDPSHSEVSFSVRHLMVSKVRGTFTRFSGSIEIADDVRQSAIEASVELGSVDTRDERRDNHLRSPEFFDVASHPTMTYSADAVRPEGEDFVVEGALSLHGVTREVPLRLELGGVGTDPWGGTRAGFSASAEIDRRDFGIDIAMPLQGGGVVVGDKVQIHLEVEAVKAA